MIAFQQMDNVIYEGLRDRKTTSDKTTAEDETKLKNQTYFYVIHFYFKWKNGRSGCSPLLLLKIFKKIDGCHGGQQVLQVKGPPHLDKFLDQLLHFCNN